MNAINTAKAVAANKDASAAAYTDAQTALHSAFLAFASAQVTAATPAAKTAAKSAAASLASAKAQYAALSTAAKSTSAAAAFRAAIDDAQSDVQNGNITTSNQATALAGKLTSAYQAAVKAGDAADLNAAQRALQVAMDKAKKSEAALASYKGSNASTVAAFNAFDGVLDAAQAVLNNRNATPAALNAAAANVAKAAATLGDTLAKNGNDFNNFKAAQNAIAALKALRQKIASTQTGVAHINYAKGYGIQIWTKDHKLVMTDATHAKKAMGGKNYKVFGSVTYINGKKFYNVGGNQYIDAAYVTFTATK